jgi:uncharacterized secreted repeat protein (TIGR03808 family)
MQTDRRRLLLASVTGAAALATPAIAAPLSAYGLDAAQFGVRPGAADDQSQKLQRALDQAAHTRVPLVLAPGVYRAGDLKLAAGAQFVGVRGATRIVLTRGPSLLSAEDADSVTLSGLTLEGGGQPLPQNQGLVRFTAVKGVRIADCTLSGVTGNAISLERCDGDISRNTITGATDNALFCVDNTGLVITANTIRGSGNGGIRIWQSEKRYDGSMVADNTIADTEARGGGDGQNGNAINVFRAADVIVRNNTIRRAAFTAVRGNAASHIQIIGNNCASLDEVAIYAEFDFEGAVIASNVIDGAALGVAVTNFNNGGRLSTVQGNIIRHLKPTRPQGGPDSAGVGISVEADTAVTGNVIEDAPFMGISVGAGKYLRDVSVTGNVVRRADYGIGVSVSPGAGAAVIANNLIAEARRGAIVGTEWDKVVTRDIAKDSGRAFPQLTLANNQVR